MLVGAIVIPQLTDLGSWRFVYLFLTVPSTLAALAIAFIGIPFLSRAREKPTEKQAYIHRYNRFCSTGPRSRLDCWPLLQWANWGLCSEFHKATILLRYCPCSPRQYSSYIFMVSTTLYVIGGLVAGRLVERSAPRPGSSRRAWRRNFHCPAFLSPSLPVALAFDWLHVWFTATAGMALTCVALDQVPEARGTMMSLKSVFGEFGTLSLHCWACLCLRRTPMQG